MGGNPAQNRLSTKGFRELLGNTLILKYDYDTMREPLSTNQNPRSMAQRKRQTAAHSPSRSLPDHATKRNTAKSIGTAKWECPWSMAALSPFRSVSKKSKFLICAQCGGDTVGQRAAVRECVVVPVSIELKHTASFQKQRGEKQLHHTVYHEASWSSSIRTL